VDERPQIHFAKQSKLFVRLNFGFDWSASGSTVIFALIIERDAVLKG
jgi:hypothetical protein